MNDIRRFAREIGDQGDRTGGRRSGLAVREAGEDENFGTAGAALGNLGDGLGDAAAFEAFVHKDSRWILGGWDG